MKTREQLYQLNIENIECVRKLHRGRVAFFDVCKRYDNIREQLYSVISQNDGNFVNLTDHDKIIYLLKLDNSDLSSYS